MKKGSLQLCFLLVAITGMHTFKIVRDGILKEQRTTKKAKNVLVMPHGSASLTTNVDETVKHFANPGSRPAVLPATGVLEPSTYSHLGAIGIQ